MATIKSYTDINQSKKLAEILPLESADMIYIMYSDGEKPQNGDENLSTVYESDEHKWYWIDIIDESWDMRNGVDILCWSLAALYGILPNNEKESTTLSRGGWKIAPPEYIDNWWCEYEDERHTKDITVSADNPVDACYEMILKLHELNLI